MAERNDITVFWSLSPRIIQIDAPSAEITIQDLHDTLRSMTEQAGEGFIDNLDDDFIIDSAGKEDLGGGVQVGITSTLQNAQLTFEPRTTPVETGTATSADANGIVLNDNTAQFITNGVTRGSFIVNFDDRSIATVISVNSETQLVHTPLLAGVADDWGIGDNYSVWNIVQCEISGGNLVAVDTNGDIMDSIYPSAFTQVLRSLSSATTLVNADNINTRVTELWQLLGLDTADAITITPSGITSQSGNITINFAGDGITSTTQTRQP